MFNAYFQSSDDFQADFSNNSEFDALLNPISVSPAGAKIYYDTKENWDLQVDLIAKKAAIYVYSDASYQSDGHGNNTPIPALKVGDGSSYLIDMPFVNADLTEQILSHVNNELIHVSEEDREKWNNKVTCYINDQNSENLIFSKN